MYEHFQIPINCLKLVWLVKNPKLSVSSVAFLQGIVNLKEEHLVVLDPKSSKVPMPSASLCEMYRPILVLLNTWSDCDRSI